MRSARAYLDSEHAGDYSDGSRLPLVLHDLEYNVETAAARRAAASIADHERALLSMGKRVTLL